MALVDDRKVNGSPDEPGRHTGRPPAGATDEAASPPAEVSPHPAATSTEDDGDRLSARRPPPAGKQVFLVAAFRRPDSAPLGSPGRGVAEDVVAVIGVDKSSHRFEWVGEDEADSIQRPALINPVPVEAAVPSPWHPDHEQMLTGLVPLSPSQLGDGPLDDDIATLLAGLDETR